jgi:hypothetical protein
MALEFQGVDRAVLLGRFSCKLHAAMKRKGLGRSPTKLAHHFNLCYLGQPVTVQAVNNWINGRSFPHFDKLIVLCDLLEICLFDLV